MMEGDTEVGRKRRLPLWMLGVSDAGEVRNSEKQDEGCFPIQGKSQPEGYRVKAKPTSSRPRKRVCKGETKTSDGDSGCLLTCETRERTRKASRRNVDPSTSFTNIREAEVQKKARNIDSRSKPTKVMKRTASTERKSKVSKNREESEAVSSMEGNEDEVELTMEDLMNIAQEYIAADCEKQHQQAVKGESKLDPFANTLGNVNADKENQQQQEVTIDLQVKACSSSKSTSVFSRKNVGLSLESAGNNTGLSKCTQAPSHLTAAGRKEKESQSLESAPIHIPRTGDAAQDMLDLFLGPLLKKPRTEERKLETITAEEMTLALQFSKQERNEVLGEGREVPLIKKKSSLKDKVAMFLD